MRLYALALAALLPGLAVAAGTARGQGFGNPAAPVVIELYSDFECPGCRQFHIDFLPQVMREFVVTGKVYLVAHDLCLPAHTHTREAAGYAFAAARIGKYREVADALFQHQPEWAANGKVWDVVAAVLSAADRAKVAKLAKDPSVLAEVQTETTDGLARIQRTPTMVVTQAMKQHRFEGMQNWGMFRDWLNELLKQ